MGKKLLSIVTAAVMLLSTAPVFAAEYLPGGQQFFEDFEISGDYKSSAYEIGMARTAKATPGTASTYILNEFDGLIIHQGDNTETGTYYDYTKEGPDANLVIEYDIYFEDLIETGSTFRMRLRDLDEYTSTNALDVTFSGNTITGKETYNYQMQDDHWYHMRHIIKGTNSSGKPVRKHDLYIDGVAVITNGALGSSNYYKFPRLDTLYLSLVASTSAIETTAYMDNVSIYKANSTAPMPVNNSGLLTEIRNAEALKNQAVFGTGIEEYAPDLEGTIDAEIAEAKSAYQSAKSESEFAAAQGKLKAFCETFEPNGEIVEVGEAVFYNNATDKPVTTLSGVSAVRAEIPVSISRFAEQEGKKVSAFLVAVSKNADGSENVEALSPMVQEILTPDPEKKARVSYTLKPIADVSSAPADAELKVVVAEDGKNPIPYYLYNDGTAVCDEVRVARENLYANDTSTMKFTAESTPQDNVVLTVYNGDSLIYANQCIADEKGIATFLVDTTSITEETTLKYYLYSTAAKKLTVEDSTYYPVGKINKALSDIYTMEQSAAEAIVVSNSALLGLDRGILGLYSSNGLVASEAVTEIKKKQYTAQELEDVQAIVLEYSQKYAMNYLQTDTLLEEILNESERNTVAPVIGIGSDEDTFGKKSAGRYQNYLKMETAEKQAVYAFIRERQDYQPDEQKSVFENAVVLAQINTAVSNDKVMSAISDNDDLLNNASAFLELDGDKQRTAAGFILDHEDFEALTDLDKYIETAVEKAEDEDDGSYKGTFGGGGSFGGGGRGGVTKAPATTLTGTTETVDKEITTLDQNVVTFTDIDNHEWANEAITVLLHKGVINGKGNNLFAPDDLVTREEFVKMVTLLFNINSDSNTCAFEDVPESAWYRSYVISAYENGVINGVSGTMFGTGQNLTREQMVTIAYNAALKAGIKFNEQAHYVPFADDKVVEEYAETALHILAGNGIINGKEENMFMPKESCTRAEAAKVLYGVYLANYR